MSAILVLPLAAVWLSVAAVAGRSLLRWSRVEPRGAAETVVLSFLLGFGLASYLVFAVGSLGWLTPATAWTVFAILILLGYPTWRSPGRDGWRSPWTGTREMLTRCRGWRWPLLALAALCALTALLNLVGALAPPTEWDSLSYHLAAPALYLQQGRIFFVPYREWANPFTAEMWNVLGLLLGSDRLPQVFQWAVGIASALALYTVAAARTSPRAGLLAATIYYTSPQIFNLSTSAKSDLAWHAFLFASLHGLLAWRERRSERWLWLAAVLMGLALGTKLQALFWAPGALLTLVMMQGLAWRKPWRPGFRVLAYGLIACVVASPWWLRNWVAGGDPIWPYGYGLFPSRFWTEALAEKYGAWHMGPGDGVEQYPLGLWNLTLQQAAWRFGPRIPVTPLILAFLPGLAVVWRDIPRQIRWFFALLVPTVAVHYTLWFYTYQLPRYLYPVLALLMAAAAYAFWEIVRFRWSRWAATGLLVGSLGTFTGFNLLFNAQFVPVVFGAEKREAYLARYVSFYQDIEWLNRNLPSDAHVLFYHLKPLYLQRRFTLGNLNVWPVNERTSAEDFMRLLRGRGITHIFITELTRRDADFMLTEGLLRDLEARGHIRPTYANPRGVWVESRTFAQRRHVSVQVLELDASGSANVKPVG